MRRRNRQPSGLSGEDRGWIAQAITDCIKRYYMPEAIDQVRRAAVEEVMAKLEAEGLLPPSGRWRP